MKKIQEIFNGYDSNFWLDNWQLCDNGNIQILLNDSLKSTGGEKIKYFVQVADDGAFYVDNTKGLVKKFQMVYNVPTKSWIYCKEDVMFKFDNRRKEFGKLFANALKARFNNSKISYKKKDTTSE